jgi:CubicO group peptidase (beta-lactamase class C family)
VPRKPLSAAIVGLLLCALFRQVRGAGVFAALPHLSAPNSTNEEPMTSEIDELLSPLTDAKSPGLAVLVRKDGQTVFSRGFGVRDLQSLSRIDSSTSFRLASCTKQFTAMAIMLLVHDSKLRYEDKLTDVFPDFPAYGRTITIRQLLNHTSGLADYESLMEAADRAASPPWSEQNQIRDAEVLALLEQQSGTQFPPGTKWSYSNSGYVTLGLIVAKVSGESFGDFLHERVFVPLKMGRTIAYERGKNEIPNRAFGHSKETSGWKQTDQSPTSATLGDGGVYSSLIDLAKWDEALARHTLLNENEMRDAITPVVLADGTQPKWTGDSDRPEGTPVSYGFGWFLDSYRGHHRMWHYGDTRGFHTYIERFVDDQLSIIVLCNRTDLDPEKIASQIADLYLQSR